MSRLTALAALTARGKREIFGEIFGLISDGLTGIVCAPAWDSPGSGNIRILQPNLEAWLKKSQSN
jgi:hypothetical protein